MDLHEEDEEEDEVEAEDDHHRVITNTSVLEDYE